MPRSRPAAGVRLLLGVSLAVTLAACEGGRGGDRPSPTANPTAPRSATPPRDAAEFWARLRALATPLAATPAPGEVAAVQARAAACAELNVLADAAMADHRAFRIETGDRLSVDLAGDHCKDPDPREQAAAASRVRAVLRHDPFASPPAS